MGVFIYLFFLIVSFYFLLKSADWLVESSSILGERLGISKLVIGLTIVAIGTSLPELFTSIFGIIDSSDSSAFVFGTVIGSNIANILLVFSILLFFSKSFKIKIDKTNQLFFIFSSLFLFFLMFTGYLNYKISILYLITILIYFYLVIKNSKKSFISKEIEEQFNDINESKLANKPIFVLICVFLLSVVILNLSAKGVVYNIEKIGILLNIPISFLTFTTIAFATSLPELMVTYRSAIEKEYELAIGNIIGSNISNTFLILGLSGLIKKILFTSNIYLFSLFFLLFSSILFLVFINFKKELKYSKIVGLFIFSLYLGYVIYLFF